MLFRSYFGDSEIIGRPRTDASVFHSYHLYVIEIPNRDDIQKQLLELGIETKVHYPKLITNQIAFINKFGNSKNITKAQFQSKRILSLPIHHHLSTNQLEFVGSQLKNVLRII